MTPVLIINLLALSTQQSETFALVGEGLAEVSTSA